MMAPSVAEKVMKVADMWVRTEDVARIIDPTAFAGDPTIHPALKPKVLQAMRKAQEVLAYLGVNTEADWYEIVTRLAER